MTIDNMNLSELSKGKHTFKLNMIKHALGEFWAVPIMVAKGQQEGPVLGITAALHGNELNGISIIHKLWEATNVDDLRGTLVFVPVLNVPGFVEGERGFYGGIDLNRIMPGKEKGPTSDVYAYNILSKIIRHLNYLIDLHTASFGRVNSLYVRADLSDAKVARMAELQEPQIIVNKPGELGTLRGEAAKMGISAITIEAGDPYLFQREHIKPTFDGLVHVLANFGMIDEPVDKIAHEPIICRSSYWLYAQNAGILQVHKDLTEPVRKGDVIAAITDIFGNVVEEIAAPEDAVVVSKSTNPVCHVGSRVIHLGIIWDNYE